MRCSRLARVRRRAIPAPAAAPPSPGLLARIAPALPVPPDRVFVTRFSAPDRPRLLTLPPGSGAVLAREVDELRRNLPQRLPLLLEDRELSRQRDALGKRYGAEEEQEVAGLRAARRGRRLRPGAGRCRAALAPRDRAASKDGQPVPLGAAPRIAVAGGVRGQGAPACEALSDELRELGRTSRDRQRRFAAELRELVAAAARTLAEEEIGDIGRHVPDLAIAPYLAELRDDIVAAVRRARRLRTRGAMERLGRRLERYTRQRGRRPHGADRCAGGDRAVPGPAEPDRLDRSHPGRADELPGRRHHDPRRRAAARPTAGS